MRGGEVLSGLFITDFCISNKNSQYLDVCLLGICHISCTNVNRNGDGQ